MSDKLNGWYWVTHGGETFPSQFTEGVSDIVDANDTRIPAERLKVGPRIPEVQAFDPATVKVGDEVLVRATIVDTERLSVRFGGHQAYMLTTDIVAGVIPAPEPPRRPAGPKGEKWLFCAYVDGRGVVAGRGAEAWVIDFLPAQRHALTYYQLAADPKRKPLTAAEAYSLLLDLGGVGAEEFCRLTGYVPKAEQPTATAYIGETKKTVWVHLSQGVGAYFGVTDGKSGAAITDKLPHDNGAFFKAIPLSEAYATIHADLREEFCKLTGYVPPKQCEGWRFTTAIGGGVYGFRNTGESIFYGLGTLWLSPAMPGTFREATDGNHRHEITASEAYEICKANGQGAKFCELTRYKP